MTHLLNLRITSVVKVDLNLKPYYYITEFEIIITAFLKGFFPFL